MILTVEKVRRDNMIKESPYHFTTIIDCFLGNKSSATSFKAGYCARIAVLIPRWMDDLTWLLEEIFSEENLAKFRTYAHQV